MSHEDDAIAYLTKAREIEPMNPYVHVSLGQVYHAKGSLGQADESFDESVVYAGNDPISYVAWGKFFQAQATELIKTIRNDRAGQAPASEIIGEIRSLLEDARIRFNTAIEASDASEQIHKGLGDVAYMEGGLAEFNASLEALEGSRVEVLQRAAGHYEEAASHYRRAQQINPEWFLPYFDLGNVAMQNKRFEDAVQYYEEAAARNPEYRDTYCRLVLAYRSIPGPDYEARLRAAEEKCGGQ